MPQVCPVKWDKVQRLTTAEQSKMSRRGTTEFEWTVTCLWCSEGQMIMLLLSNKWRMSTLKQTVCQTMAFREALYREGGACSCFKKRTVTIKRESHVSTNQPIAHAWALSLPTKIGQAAYKGSSPHQQPTATIQCQQGIIQLTGNISYLKIEASADFKDR